MTEKINEIGMLLYARDKDGQVTRAPKKEKVPPYSIDLSKVPPYDGAELRPYEGRPGAMDAFRLPSRGLK